MCTHQFHRFSQCRSLAAVLTAAVILVVSQGRALAESTAAPKGSKTTATLADPFESIKADNTPYDTVLSDTPVDAAAYVPPRARWESKQTNFDAPVVAPLPEPNNATIPSANAAVKDPCAAARFKPLNQLGISIAQPSGDSPTDFATPCWNQINSGPNGACRCWPVMCYQWDATCLCYHPLYFEEVNAERYGYVCGGKCCPCRECLWQPACSAAHFFGTIPALPYCMLADCPTECVYTLGYYRPGDCVPWCRNYPSCDPVAAVGTAGVYTGLIFAIP